QMPMNIKARRKINPTADCLQDLERFEEIVQTCYQRVGQSKGYLLGEFSIVDVFYAPVIFRLKTYAPYFRYCVIRIDFGLYGDCIKS
ncbi:hypothetical protein QUS59_22725, partial [Xanthomonas citri pv. citri]